MESEQGVYILKKYSPSRATGVRGDFEDLGNKLYIKRQAFHPFWYFLPIFLFIYPKYFLLRSMQTYLTFVGRGAEGGWFFKKICSMHP